MQENRGKPRLREKLAAAGPEGMEETELLALLLGTGSRGVSVLDLARKILSAAGGLCGLACSSPGGRSSHPGLGPAQGCRLAAALEIGRRVHAGGIVRPAVRGPEDVIREVRDLAGERREHLVGLYLDAQARLIARETVAVGSLNVARAVPRDLLEPALRHLAAGFVMVHNHPSGVPEPSEDDLRFTRSVARAATLMGVALHDHLVVAREGHISLRERGVSWEGQMGPDPG